MDTDWCHSQTQAQSTQEKKKGYASILLAAYAAKKEFGLAVLNDSDADPCQFL